MKLAEALGISPGQVTAFVGAGGKTMAIWLVQAELASAGAGSISTTTTKIMEPVLPHDGALYLAAEPDAARLEGLLKEAPRLTLAARRLSEAYPPREGHPIPSRPYKLEGLPPEVLDGLVSQLPGVTWLVEADGAKGAGLKVPAAHEPVIPQSANLVVVMAHLDVLGHGLDETTVHRASEATALLGVATGTRLTPELFARVLCDPARGLKGVPEGAPAVLLLTQRDTTMHPEALTLAKQVLAGQPRYGRAVVAALRAREPVLEVVMG